ncbi:MAG: hypothetical protein JRI49_08355 [Deltaproteobacteria bacterium]|nr:hypothetical protein [Deltaproteobacteria bacterium]
MHKEGEEVKWYYKPINVILALFLVLGPFGLPLLYKSPKFNKLSKLILTILVIVYTLLLIYSTLEIGRFTYEKIEELKNISETFQSTW